MVFDKKKTKIKENNRILAKLTLKRGLLIFNFNVIEYHILSLLRQLSYDMLDYRFAEPKMPKSGLP